MKKLSYLFATFIIILITIYGCSSSGKIDTASLGGKWLLKELNATKIVKEKTGGDMLYLTFNLNNNTVGGSTGCNEIGGKVTVAAEEISFSEMWQTKINCTDAEYEYDFTNYLFNASPLKYKIENKIMNFFRDGKVIMIFEKVK